MHGSTVVTAGDSEHLMSPSWVDMPDGGSQSSQRMTACDQRQADILYCRYTVGVGGRTSPEAEAEAGDTHSFEMQTSGEHGDLVGKGQGCCSACIPVLAVVVPVEVGRLASRTEESWIHQSSSDLSHKCWQNGWEQMEAVVGSWLADSWLVESIQDPALTSDDLCCRVYAHLYYHY